MARNCIQDIVLAAAQRVVVVNARSRVSNVENVSELTVGHPLRDLAQLLLHGWRQALTLRLLFVVEEAAVKAKPDASHSL